MSLVVVKWTIIHKDSKDLTYLENIWLISFFFHFQGDSNFVTSVNDPKDFDAVCNALKVCDFSPEEQEVIFLSKLKTTQESPNMFTNA